MNKAKSKPAKGFPEVITHLPPAEILVEGAKGWILHSEASQLVFFEFKQGTILSVFKGRLNRAVFHALTIQEPS